MSPSRFLGICFSLENPNSEVVLGSRRRDRGGETGKEGKLTEGIDVAATLGHMRLSPAQNLLRNCSSPKTYRLGARSLEQLFTASSPSAHHVMATPGALTVLQLGLPEACLASEVTQDGTRQSDSRAQTQSLSCAPET